MKIKANFELFRLIRTLLVLWLFYYFSTVYAGLQESGVLPAGKGDFKDSVLPMMFYSTLGVSFLFIGYLFMIKMGGYSATFHRTYIQGRSNFSTIRIDLSNVHNIERNKHFLVSDIKVSSMSGPNISMSMFYINDKDWRILKQMYGDKVMFIG